MNTGIQDAYNLAWKMALVLRGAADVRLLDSYEAERRPVGAEVVERTRQASMSFGHDRGRKANRLEDTQILVNYRGSAWVLDAAGARKKAALRAGDRAPDARGLRQDHVGFPLRLFEVLRGTAHVLVIYLTGRAARQLAVEIEALARDLGIAYADAVRVVAITAAQASVPEPIGATLFADGEGEFARALPPSRDRLSSSDRTAMWATSRMRSTAASCWGFLSAACGSRTAETLLFLCGRLRPK